MIPRSSALNWLMSSAACGLAATLATGAVRNDPEIVIPEIIHYGYPLPWLVTDMNGPTQFIPGGFALDAAFWAVAALLVLVLLRGFRVRFLGLRIK